MLQRDKFEVDAGYRLGGEQKHRKWFKTLEEAKTYAEQINIRLKNEGLSGFSLTSEEQIDAQKALKTVKGLGVTLTGALSFYTQNFILKGAEMTFGELVDDQVPNWTMIELKEKVWQRSNLQRLQEQA